MKRTSKPPWHTKPTPECFTGLRGGALRYNAFYARIWKPTLTTLGLPSLGLHVLRHSAVAAMISAGATPKAVQTVMGHRSMAFTMTVYGHLFDADLDDLADRLDALPRDVPRPVHGLAPAVDPRNKRSRSA